VALAGRVIASHYAEPASRRLRVPATLRSSPRRDGEAVEELGGDEAFEMLDDSLGWAWGYAGKERRVGYLPSETLAKD
jgi:hypothetical protein